MTKVALSRRMFLRSFGALAAAAVVAPKMLIKSAPTEVERLLAMMATGVVEDQTFFFTGPITIQVKDLIIRHCHFVFRCVDTVVEPWITIDGAGLVMDNCYIDGDSECGIKILPQPSDMTSTIQSAITTLSNGSDTERVLALGTGFYAINSLTAGK